MSSSKVECSKLLATTQGDAETLEKMKTAHTEMETRCVELQNAINQAVRDASKASEKMDSEMHAITSALARSETERLAALDAKLQLEKDTNARTASSEDAWSSQRAIMATELTSKVEALASLEAEKQAIDEALSMMEAEADQISRREDNARERSAKDAEAWVAREAELEASVASKAFECAELRAKMHGVHEAEQTLLDERRTLNGTIAELESRYMSLQEVLVTAEGAALEANGTAEASVAKLQRVESSLRDLESARDTQAADAFGVTDRVLARASAAEARCVELEATLTEAKLSAKQSANNLSDKLDAESSRLADLSVRLEASAADSLLWRTRLEDETALRHSLETEVKEHENTEATLMQHTVTVSNEANERLAEIETAVLSLSPSARAASVEQQVASRVQVVGEAFQEAFQQQLKTVEDQAAKKLAAAEQSRSALEDQVDELARQLQDGSKDDWNTLQQDLTNSLLKTDKESRKRVKAEARANEAWEELSELHESIESTSRTSLAESSHNNLLEDCLRDQIAGLKTKVELVGAVHAQLLVDGHKCSLKIERSAGSDGLQQRSMNLPPRSAVEVWAASTGTELRGASAFGAVTGGLDDDDISPIPRGGGDVSSVDQHTRALLLATREELTELARAKELAEKELRREVKRRRQVEASQNDWENTSVSVADHETQISIAVETAVAESEEKAQQWIMRIQEARSFEREAIEEEREEALAERLSLQSKLSRVMHQLEAFGGSGGSKSRREDKDHVSGAAPVQTSANATGTQLTRAKQSRSPSSTVSGVLLGLVDSDSSSSDSDSS